MSSTSLVKIGWWLFVVSAVLFAWSAIRARDWTAAAGAAAFFVANIFFMTALRRDGGHDR